jgi:hypothetical protein
LPAATVSRDDLGASENVSRIGEIGLEEVGPRMGGTAVSQTGRVERWRGGLGLAYLLPALSSAGASIASPCSVSTSRSSNPACGFPAPGSPTGFSHQHTNALFRLGRDSEKHRNLRWQAKFFP